MLVFTFSLVIIFGERGTQTREKTMVPVTPRTSDVASLPYYEGFDDELVWSTQDEWNPSWDYIGYSPGTYTNISATDTHESLPGEMLCWLKDWQAGSNPSMELNITPTTEGMMEMDILAAWNSDPYANMYWIRGLDASSVMVWDIMIDMDATTMLWKYAWNGGEEGTYSRSPQTWYNLSVQFNTSSNAYALYSDGSLIQDAISLGSMNPVEKIWIGTIGTIGGCDLILDNITITGTTIPPDVVDPTITIDSPSSNQWFDTPSIPLTVEAGDNVAVDTIWYVLDGESPVGLPTNTTLVVSEGPHDLTVYVNDTSNNINSESVHFTVDSLNPTISISAPINESMLPYDLIGVSFSATDINLESTWYSLDGGEPVLVSGDFSLKLSDGNYNLIIFGNDSAGNVGSDFISFTINTTGLDSILVEDFEDETNWSTPDEWDPSWDYIGYSPASHTNISATSGVPYLTTSMIGWLKDWQSGSNPSMELDILSTSSGQITMDITGSWNTDGFTKKYWIRALDSTSAAIWEVIIDMNTSTKLWKIAWLGGAQASYIYPEFTWANISVTFNVSQGFYSIFHNNDLVQEGIPTASTNMVDSIWIGTIGTIGGCDLVLDNITFYGTIYDDIAPNIIVDSPLNNSYFPTTLVPLSVEVSDNVELDSIWYELDGQAAVMLPSNTSLTMPEGSHQIIIFANDTSNNIASKTIQFTVDTTNPSLDVHSPLNNSKYDTDSIPLNVEVADNVEIDTIWYVLDGQSLVFLPTNTTLTIPDGNHELIIYVNDSSNHITSETIYFTVDTMSPIISILSPGNNSGHSSNSVPLTVEVEDNLMLDEVWYVLDGQSPVFLPTNTTLTIPDGDHELIIYANDTTGNIQSETSYFKVDTVNPILTINSPLNNTYLDNNSFSLNVRAVDGDGIDAFWYELDGQPAILLPSNTTLTLPDGDHQIMVYVNDTSGNIDSKNITFTIDTIAPSLILVNPAHGMIFLHDSTIPCMVVCSDDNLDKVWYVIDESYPVFVNGTFNLDLIQGVHNLTVFCNDSAGHLVNDTAIFRINNPDDEIVFSEDFSSESNWATPDQWDPAWVYNGYSPASHTNISATDVHEISDGEMIGWIKDWQAGVNSYMYTSFSPMEYGIFSLDLATAFNSDLYEKKFWIRGLDGDSNMVWEAIIHMNATTQTWKIDWISGGEEGFTRQQFAWSELKIIFDTRVSQYKIKCDNNLIVRDIPTNNSNPIEHIWIGSIGTIGGCDMFIDNLMLKASLDDGNGFPPGSDLILIIIIISGAAGVVITVAYNRRKSSSSVKAPRTKKKKVSGDNYTGDFEEQADAYRKRSRLMEFEIGNSHPMKVPAKANKVQNKIDRVDINKRKVNANKMESEVQLEKVTQKCVVHKGGISGLSYTCKMCGATYCMKCAKHLLANGEPCWLCQASIDFGESVEKEVIDNPTRSLVQKLAVTLFSDDVWRRLDQLQLEPEIFNEVIEDLKEIRPEQRLKHLEEIFYGEF